VAGSISVKIPGHYFGSIFSQKMALFNCGRKLLHGTENIFIENAANKNGH
jgi:hypothetical protein